MKDKVTICVRCKQPATLGKNRYRTKYGWFHHDCEKARLLEERNKHLLNAVEMMHQRDELSWTPITPEHLPKITDEVIGTAMVPIACMAEARYEEWIAARWTHFRPLNPPIEKE